MMVMSDFSSAAGRQAHLGCQKPARQMQITKFAYL